MINSLYLFEAKKEDTKFRIFNDKEIYIHGIKPVYDRKKEVQTFLYICRDKDGICEEVELQKLTGKSTDYLKTFEETWVKKLLDKFKEIKSNYEYFFMKVV